MSPTQQNVVSLAKLLEEKQNEINEVRKQLEQQLVQLGVGNYARDEETGTVYKAIVPRGTFVYFREIDYVRTAKEGERGGTVLSKKEAEEAISQGKV